MKIVVFGLAVSSSWGNGHATLWRGLCRSLGRLGHQVIFFERDVPYYASHRDLLELEGGRLILYPEWAAIRADAQRQLADADVGMITSFCPDAIPASDLVLSSPVSRKVFYDLDTPITLCSLGRGEPVAYIGPRGLRDFDLVLSYTGGRALVELQTKLGARRVVPLYGSVDPAVHAPAPRCDRYAADLSYLGTFSEDRNVALHALFVEPARRLPEQRFVLGGSMYGTTFPWQPNIHFVHHVPPGDHSSFYSSSRLTLNVTRGPMAQMGFCPSGRLFEAAACRVPVLTDFWEGLDQFFEPGREILIAHSSDDTVEALFRRDLRPIARAAQERVLACHTSDIRARELETILESAHVGNCSGSREGQSNSAAGVF